MIKRYHGAIKVLYFLLGYNITLMMIYCVLGVLCGRSAPLLSLWGEVAEFSAHCTHWKLEPHVFIPTLDQFTICLRLKFQVVTLFKRQ